MTHEQLLAQYNHYVECATKRISIVEALIAYKIAITTNDSVLLAKIEVIRLNDCDYTNVVEYLSEHVKNMTDETALCYFIDEAIFHIITNDVRIYES